MYIFRYRSNRCPSFFHGKVMGEEMLPTLAFQAAPLVESTKDPRLIM
jgi:hypothetical protein